MTNRDERDDYDEDRDERDDHEESFSGNFCVPVIYKQDLLDLSPKHGDIVFVEYEITGYVFTGDTWVKFSSTVSCSSIKAPVLTKQDLPDLNPDHGDQVTVIHEQQDYIYDTNTWKPKLFLETVI